jgi:hypothetical protein
MPASQQVARPIDRFEDEQGRTWIWIRDADREYRIAFSNLNHWTSNRCPYIDKKLRFHDRPGPFGHVRRYLLEAEVSGIRDAMDCERKVTHPPSDPDVLPLAEIEKLLPTAKRGFLLYAHRHPERCHGHPLWAAKLVAFDEAGKRRKKMWHMRLSQVKALLAAAPNTRTPDLQPYTDPRGNVWYPTKVARQMGLYKEKLREARRRKHTALGRPIRYLKPKDVPAEFRANRQVYFYNADDCHCIEEWLKRTSKQEKAKAIICQAIRNGPIDCRTVITKANREGISRRTLGAARTAEGVKSTRVGNPIGGTTYWHRASQKLPSATAVSTVPFEPVPSGRPKTRSRGRPRASEDQRVKERRTKIVDTWMKHLRGGDDPSVSQVARECNVDRTTVKAALQEAGIDWRR